MKKINKKVLIEVELVLGQQDNGDLTFDFDDNVDILNDVGKNFEIGQIKNLKVEEIKNA